jgi:hypothetical protein
LINNSRAERVLHCRLSHERDVIALSEAVENFRGDHRDVLQAKYLTPLEDVTLAVYIAHV